MRPAAKLRTEQIERKDRVADRLVERLDFDLLRRRTGRIGEFSEFAFTASAIASGVETAEFEPSGDELKFRWLLTAVHVDLLTIEDLPQALPSLSQPVQKEPAGVRDVS